MLGEIHDVHIHWMMMQQESNPLLNEHHMLREIHDVYIHWMTIQQASKTIANKIYHSEPTSRAKHTNNNLQS